MGLAAQKRATWNDFRELENNSEEKYEFHDGDIVAMAGATPRHAYLTVAMSTALTIALRGRPCKTYSPDLLVSVPPTERGFHPDVTVVCGPLQRFIGDRRGIINPILIVEVLSDSTEGFDRGEKFFHYRQLPPLQDYVLINQDRELVEVYSRSGSSWILQTFGPGTKAMLPSLGIEMDVDALYEGAPDDDVEADSEGEPE